MEKLQSLDSAVNGIADFSAIFSGAVFGVGYDHTADAAWRTGFLRLAGSYIDYVTECHRRGAFRGCELVGDCRSGFVVGDEGATVFESGGGGVAGVTAGSGSRGGVSSVDVGSGEVASARDVEGPAERGASAVCGAASSGSGGSGVCGGGSVGDAGSELATGFVGQPRGKHYAKNRGKKLRAKAAREKQARMQQSWRGYCETVASEKPSSVPSSCPGLPSSVGLPSSASSRTLVEAKQAAEESLARRRVVENELAIVKTKAQIASYADVEKSKAIAELKIARIAQWNNEARMKSQKSWADYKRSLASSPEPSFKASDLPSAASAGEYWWKQQCLKSKEMEEQIKHLEALLKASMPYVTPEGLEKMREVPDPEPVIDPEFEALKRAHRELAVAEGLDGYDSGDDIGYDLFMPPRNL